MGKITGAALNSFKSAEFVYSKIKREFKSFGNANLLDDADFPLYTAEVLRELGQSAQKEEEALLFVKDGKACLPNDFLSIYAAYKCKLEGTTIAGSKHLQNKQVFYNETDYELLSACPGKCTIDCTEDPNHLSKITIRQYVQEGEVTYTYRNPILLRLSPNVKSFCADECLNLMATGMAEITINNREIFTNFKDEDIYLKYYAMPTDDNGMPMIPDIKEVEKAVEWYIKYQILLNFWLVDDVTNIQSKWSKAEEQYEMAMASARYIGKLPAFSTMLNEARNQRGINKVTFFSQQDRHY